MGGSIEEFLKMAAARRQQGAQQRPQAQQPMVIEDVEIVDAQPVQKTMSTGRFQTKVDTSDVTEHAAHLGEGISRQHDRVEQRLHDKFDHDVGKLNVPDDQTVSDDAYGYREQTQSRFMSELVGMLSNPRSIGQAIILNEILKRPDFDDF